MSDEPRTDATVDLPPSGDPLDAALAAGFGPDSGPPLPADGSVVQALGAAPVVLRDPTTEPEGPVLKPYSDALPADAASRYRIDGEIARGGMGAVLKGRDTDLGRDIAVKVLLETHRGKTELVQRFVEEAQIGGQLQHPNITPVYELGQLKDKRPYFAMKLVKGKTLAALLAERKNTAQDRPRFLGIFLQVCQALAYAHARGVIHRDLKPANIMVGAFGEVQVMDWGLAKVLRTGGIADEQRALPPEATVIRTVRTGSDAAPRAGSATVAGQVMGTIAYMAPEQARGEVADLDERCDVFGLGAMLCELLTGRPAYHGRDGDEVWHRAFTADLGDALARLDGCGADADLVGLAKRCLASFRKDRPRDAGALAQELSAYLESVEARLRRAELERAAAEVQTREERKRRRVQLALAGSVVLLLLGIGTAGWWYQQRRADTDRTTTFALAKADAARSRAEGLPITGEAEATAQRLEWQNAAAALAEAEAALKTGAGTDDIRQRVAEAREQIERGKAEAGRKEKLFHGLDEARMASAAMVENTFDFAGAAAMYQAAFAAYGLEVKPGNIEELVRRIRAEDSAVHAALLVALDDWQSAAFFARTTPSAAALQAITAAADDDPWRQRYRQAAAAHDGARLRDLSVEARRLALPPSSLTLLARQLCAVGERAEAVAMLRWARHDHPADFWIHFELGSRLENPDHIERTSSLDLEESVGCFRAALALRPQATVVYTNLGISLNLKKQWDDAIAAYKRAIEIDPKNAAAHRGLGRALLAKNQLDDAIAAYNKAITLDPKDAKAHNKLGNVLYAKKQWDDAITEYNKAIALDPNDAKAHSDLGGALGVKKQWDDAIAEHNKAIALDPKYANAHIGLGLALQAKNQLDDAIAEYNKAIALEPKNADAHNKLGNVLYAKNLWDDAIAERNKAIALDPKDANAHIGLGLALEAKNQLDDAIAEFKQAIAIDPNYAPAHGNLGNALSRKGRFAEAKTSVQQALKLLPDNHPQRAFALRQLQQCEDWLALEAKLPDVLAGKTPLADNRERLGLLEISQRQQRYAAVAKLAADAFAADAMLADDLKAGHRYNAACAAALAATGQGKDADKLDDKELSRLRKQAVEWLRADLAAWTKQAASDKPSDRTLVQKTLQHWQEDTDLAGIRDKDALAKLPADEREACQKLWADVAEVVKKAGQ